MQVIKSDKYIEYIGHFNDEVLCAKLTLLADIFAIEHRSGYAKFKIEDADKLELINDKLEFKQYVLYIKSNDDQTLLDTLICTSPVSTVEILSNGITMHSDGLSEPVWTYSGSGTFLGVCTSTPYKPTPEYEPGDTFNYSRLIEPQTVWINEGAAPLPTIVNGIVYMKRTVTPDINNITDLTGTTWILNETISSSNTFEYQDISFTSNNTNFNLLVWQNSGEIPLPGVYPGLNYGTAPDMLYEYIYNSSTNEWADETYRTISITGRPDATNATLINWFKANATLAPVYELVPVNLNQVTSSPLYCLTFSSPNTFSIIPGDTGKAWEGTLEYSTDGINWTVWQYTTNMNSSQTGSTKYLYLRGSNNTIISSYITWHESDFWYLNGSNVSCTGNIETLLDYQTVTNGGHPTIGYACFCGLFYDWTGLISAPSLPSMNLAYDCYGHMFQDCSNLETLPELPATDLSSNNAYYCYDSMFSGCSKIKISTTQTGEYQTPFRIPSSGTGTGSIHQGDYPMFDSTGGTFKGTPTINTTYYTSNQIVSATNIPTTTINTIKPITLGYTAPTISLISFTIGANTYQAEAGMTWSEWVNSEYNTAGYFVNVDTIIRSGGGVGFYYVNNGSTEKIALFEITANGIYSETLYSGGAGF